MAVVRSRSSSETGDGLTAGLACRTVGTPAGLADHLRIRAAVFVEEQRIFEGTDRDPTDDLPGVHHVVGYVDRTAAGTVRLYPVKPEEPGERLWKGDRLAVLPGFRHVGLGAPLVRHAVMTAGALGGDRMIAYIQPENVVFFQRLGWTCVGDPAPYVGIPHQKMSIPLT